MIVRRKRQDGDVAVASISLEAGVFDIVLSREQANNLHQAIAEAFVHGKSSVRLPDRAALVEHEDNGT